MSAASPEPEKYEITTRRGRKVIVEAPYITVEEAKIVSTLVDAVTDTVLEELARDYYIEFEFTLPTGQTVKVRAQLKKVAG